MKTSSFIIKLVAVGMAVMVIGRVRAEDPPSGGDISPEQMAKMIAEWQALSEPGKPHEHLRQLVGKWNTVSKTWWGGPQGQRTLNPLRHKGLRSSKAAFSV